MSNDFIPAMVHVDPNEYNHLKEIEADHWKTVSIISAALGEALESTLFRGAPRELADRFCEVMKQELFKNGYSIEFETILGETDVVIKKSV